MGILLVGLPMLLCLAAILIACLLQEE